MGFECVTLIAGRSRKSFPFHVHICPHDPEGVLSGTQTIGNIKIQILLGLFNRQKGCFCALALFGFFNVKNS
jgi:hypothetical protein